MGLLPCRLSVYSSDLSIIPPVLPEDPAVICLLSIYVEVRSNKHYVKVVYWNGEIL